MSDKHLYHNLLKVEIQILFIFWYLQMNVISMKIENAFALLTTVLSA